MPGVVVPGLVGAAIAVLPTPARATVRQVTLRWGPVALGAYQVRRDTSFPRTPLANGFITAMSARLVDANGNAAPVQRMMLHHVLFSNEGGPERSDRVDGACPDVPRQRFFGRGEEGRALDLPAGYGYPIASGDRWRMNWMLMNHTYKTESCLLYTSPSPRDRS